MSSQLASQLRKLQLRPVGGASEKSILTSGSLSSGASFLFSKTDAKSYSREQILELATDGLKTLLQRDNRIQPFLSVLFSPETTRQERGMLTTEETKQRNQDLETFLVFLSPHLFLVAAHQVLEYLIRVHEVHVYNVTALIRAFLPYHDHNIFSRMLLLVDVRDTGFDFLATNQDRGAPLVRESLMIACAQSRRVLQQVCYAMLLPVRLGIYHGAANALFAAVATRLATPLSSSSSSTNQSPESLFRQLLPFLLECLSLTAPNMETVRAHGDPMGQSERENTLFPDEEKGGEGDCFPKTATAVVSLGSVGHRRAGDVVPIHAREAVCTAVLVVASWSTDAQLTVPTLLTILKPLVAFTAEQAHHQQEGEEDVFIMPLENWLCVLNVIFRRQTVLQTDRNAFTALLTVLLQLPWKTFAAQHAAFLFSMTSPHSASSSGCSPLSALLDCLMQFALERFRVCHQLSALSTDVRNFLLTAAAHLPLSPALVKEVLFAVMRTEQRILAHSAEQGTPSRAPVGVEEELRYFTHMYQALERQYQHVFDAALSDALRGEESAKPKAGGSSKTRLSSSETGLLAKAAISVLTRHLDGTRYEMIDLKGVSATDNSSMYLAASSSSSSPGGAEDRLPLFACLMHPSAEVRLLAARTIQEKISLRQLVSASSSAARRNGLASTTHQNSASGSSLLELVAHVLAYETEASVAIAFLKTLGLPLQYLMTYLGQSGAVAQRASSGASSKKKKKVAGEEVEAALQTLQETCSLTYAQGAVMSLLEAARRVALSFHLTSALSLPNATRSEVERWGVQEAYWKDFLMPVLEMKEGSNTTTHTNNNEEEDKDDTMTSRVFSAVWYDAAVVYEWLFAPASRRGEAATGSGESTLSSPLSAVQARLKTLFRQRFPGMPEECPSSAPSPSSSHTSSFSELWRHPHFLRVVFPCAAARLPELMQACQDALQKDVEAVDMSLRPQHSSEEGAGMRDVPVTRQKARRYADALYTECALCSTACVLVNLTATPTNNQSHIAAGTTALQLLRFLLGSRLSQQLVQGLLMEKSPISLSAAASFSKAAAAEQQQEAAETAAQRRRAVAPISSPVALKDGYLFALQQLQREALRVAQEQQQQPQRSSIHAAGGKDDASTKKNSSQRQDSSQKIGRGATDNRLVAGYLPSNGFLERLAEGVWTALQLALPELEDFLLASSSTTTTRSNRAEKEKEEAVREDSPCSVGLHHGDALHLTLLLLPLLGSSLPCLSAAPSTLPYSYFRLLECGTGPKESFASGGFAISPHTAALQELERGFQLCFYAEVHGAVFPSTSSKKQPSSARTFSNSSLKSVEGSKKANKNTENVPWGALGLVLLLPLSAPDGQRQSHLQWLQDAVLRAAMPGKKGSGEEGAPHAAVDVLRRGLETCAALCSMTSYSAIVESLAKASSRFQVPHTAAQLLGHCLATRWTEGGAHSYVMPRSLATLTLEQFFAEAFSNPAKSGRPTSSFFPLELLYPSVAHCLESSRSPAKSKSSSSSALPRSEAAVRSAPSSSAAALHVWPAEVVAYVEAVCRRCHLTPEALNTTAASETKTGCPRAASKKDDAAVQPEILRLVLHLLHHPFLHVLPSRSPIGTDAATSSSVPVSTPQTTVARPVYRYALQMLATALEQGDGFLREDSEGIRQQSSSGPLIFRASAKKDNTTPTRADHKDATTKAKKGAASSQQQVLTENQVQQIADAVRPALFSALLRMGSGARDIAQLCVQTVGGFHRVFLPLLHGCCGGTAPPLSHLRLDRQSGVELLMELMEYVTPSEHRLDDALAHKGGASSVSCAQERRWEPHTCEVLLSPLTFEHLDVVLQICFETLHSPANATPSIKNAKKLEGVMMHRPQTPQEDASVLTALRLLSTVVQMSPTIATASDLDSSDDDDNDEGRALPSHRIKSLFAFIHDHFITRFSLSAFLPLLVAAEGPDHPNQKKKTHPTDRFTGDDVLTGGAQLWSLFTHPVLQIFRQVVHLSVHCATTLREHRTAGSEPSDMVLRTALLKDGLRVMAELLLPKPDSRAINEEPQGHNNEEDEGAAAFGTTAAADSSSSVTASSVALTGELLQSLTPLLAPASFSPLSTSAARRGGSPSHATASQKFSLHIPIVALLVRLEPVAYTPTLGYKSSVDVCREILTRFDIGTQMRCLSQLMELVSDPSKALQPASSSSEEESLSKLFRRLVKPNQIINRQELLLQVINTAVKSDAFLAPFIQLQYEQNASKKSNPSSKSAEEVDQTPAEESATGDSVACTALLTNALSLFSHYSDLNQATPYYRSESSQTEHQKVNGDQAAEDYSEEKSYVMLLELLAGNTLACVLAGINEPTFVRCLETLLVDPLPTVQLKGLEVLLDRLHHSLPTLVEDGLSGAQHDEELEEYRRRLRDPKVKLNLMDLVRVKARPLTTKRTFALQEHLAAMITKNLEDVLHGAKLSAVASAAGSESESDEQQRAALLLLDQRFRRVLLAVACSEELVRIVGSGGSLQAEKTLLNVHRSKGVTEGTLVKMYGNKKRLDLVHEMVHALCSTWVPQLEATLLKTSKKKSSGPSQLQPQQQQGLMAVMAGCFTLLGSCAQVLGAGFMLLHAQEVLHLLLNSAVLQVTRLTHLTLLLRSEGSSSFTAFQNADNEEMQSAYSLLRYATFTATLRCFPSCWHMSQPYLTPLLLVATHQINVQDTRTSPLCHEVLAVLEAVMEPQLLLRAAAEAVWGWTAGAEEPAMATPSTAHHLPGAGATPLQLRTQTHAIPLFYQSVTRLLERLKKEELSHLRYLCEGTRPQDNFWLASLDILASSPTLPPSDVTVPVLQAFKTFFIKFKAKHCNVFLSSMALWAFGEAAHEGPAASTSSSGGPSASQKKKPKRLRREGDSGGSSSDEERETDREANASGSSSTGQGPHALTRSVLQRWTLYYTLYHSLLHELGSIMEFSFGVVMPYIIQHLLQVNGDEMAHVRGDDDDHVGVARSSPQHKSLASRVTVFLETLLLVLQSLCSACTPAADHDYSIPPDVYIAHTEIFNHLMPPLVRQLSNLHGLADAQYSFEHRAEHHVLPALRSFFIAVGSTGNSRSHQLQSKTQAEVLRLLRHPEAVVRRVALKALDKLYADGGEELAARLMAEMLPAVVELTEDRDALVVEEAKELCNHLSTITGQDVLHAMSG